MNWMIIAAIILAFAFQIATSREQSKYIHVPADQAFEEETQPYQPPESIIKPFILDGWTVKGLFGHMWLHGNAMHIVGNLLFLWIFGNAVCAKLGNPLYLLTYLIGGLSAAACHILTSDSPAIGASGAIFGVIGMYLVFFTLNEVNCLLVVFFPLVSRPYARPICISGFWIISLWVIKNIFGVFMGTSPIAYMAHIGGFFAGFLIAILLLMSKLIRMEKYEKSLLQIWDQRKEIPEPVPDRRFGIYLNQLEDIKAAEKEKKQDEPITLKIIEPQGQPVEFNEQDFSHKQPIHFACTCGKGFLVPPHFAGKTSKCPKCNHPLIIPDR
jgi:membrane associated rhomboid family serine protease